MLKKPAAGKPVSGLHAFIPRRRTPIGAEDDDDAEDPDDDSEDDPEDDEIDDDILDEEETD